MSAFSQGMQGARANEQLEIKKEQKKRKTLTDDQKKTQLKEEEEDKVNELMSPRRIKLEEIYCNCKYAC